MLWAVLILTLGAAAPLEEDIDFQEGKRLVDELDYERAIFRFQKLAKSDRPADHQATINAWLGLTYANLGDEPEAIKAFVIAIKLDPLVALPPSSPKIAQTFDKARKIARDELHADSDDDGVADSVDKCPAVKETLNGVVDDDGCPDEPDHDGDTVPDVSDACPDSAGEVAQQGCPTPKGPSGLLISGATVLTVAVVGFGVSGVSGFLALQEQQKAEAANFQDDRQGLKGNADGYAFLANLGYVVGGSLVVTGAVLVGLSLLGGDA